MTIYKTGYIHSTSRITPETAFEFDSVIHSVQQYYERTKRRSRTDPYRAFSEHYYVSLISRLLSVVPTRATARIGASVGFCSDEVSRKQVSIRSGVNLRTLIAPSCAANT